MKHPNGMPKPIGMPQLSAIQPMSNGMKAPPTMDMTMKEEAIFVFSPRP